MDNKNSKVRNVRTVENKKGICGQSGIECVALERMSGWNRDCLRKPCVAVKQRNKVLNCSCMINLWHVALCFINVVTVYKDINSWEQKLPELILVYVSYNHLMKLILFY